MVRYKLYGILSMLIFSLPKIYSTSATAPRESSNVITPKEEINAKSIPLKRAPIAASKPPTSINVSASVYFPVESQTDSTPFITADGSHINKTKPSKHRWIAVSRNLLRRWGGTIDYGDTLQVKGISNRMDGMYIVRDTMTRRIKNRIDILVGSDDDIMGFWQDVKIYNLN